MTGGSFPGPPVITQDGRAYVASNDRYLYAYSPGGELLWRYDLRAKPTGRACVTPDGLVIVERSDGTLVAVNPAAKTVWSRRQGNAPACAANGVIYRVEDENRLLAISARGSVMWRVEVGASVVTGPVVVGQTVVIAHAGGLSAWNRSGGELWRVSLPGTATSIGASLDGTIHVGLVEGGIVDIFAGEVIAHRQAGTDAVTAVVVDEVAGTVYALSAGGFLFAAEGVETADADAAATPAALRVWADDTEGSAGKVAAVVARNAGGIFMLMTSGEIRELESADAETRRLVPAPAVVGGRRHPATFAIGRDGRAVVAGPGWTVSAVRAGRPGGGWSHARAGAHGRAVLAGPPTVAHASHASQRGASEEIDRIYLSRLLSSGDASDRRRALDDIAARLDEGGLAGSYRRVVEYLLAFVSENAVAGRGPAERMRAVRMLAEIGDYGVRDELVRIARSSNDRSIRIAVLQSVQHMPVDDEGRTARMIHTVLRQEARRGADSRLGRAGIDAIKGYVSYRGSVEDADLGAAIGVLATAGFPPEIRREVAGLAAELY
ncbi:MAG: PQQ-binding-like beta-propeller repeat protein [Spirochaetes bacterium]|nr:PQQ-binding-like beta-propeller repeat protein [Spirochaetota bacterium]